MRKLIFLAIGALVCPGCGSPDHAATNELISSEALPLTDADAASAAARAAKDVVLQNGKFDQIVPHLVVRGDGTSYLARYSMDAASNFDIYLQRLDKSGRKLWAPDGIRVSSKSSISWVADYMLATDAQDDAVLVYTNTDDFVVRAQKVDRRGALKWGADGVVLSPPGVSAGVPQAVRCSDGEMAVSWVESFSIARVQRLDGHGKARWSAPFSIDAAPGDEVTSVQLLPGPGGSLFVVWVDAAFNTPGDAFIQQLDSHGRPVWSDAQQINGKPKLPFMGRPLLARDGRGGVYAAWTAIVDSMFQARIQHFDRRGAKLWDAEGLPAANEEGMSQFAAALTFVPASSRAVLALRETDPAQDQAGTLLQAFDAEGGTLWANPGLTIVPADLTTGSAAINLRPVRDGVAVFYKEGPWAGMEATVQVATVGLTPEAKPKVTTLSAVPSVKQDAEVSELNDGGYWTVWADARSDATAIYGTWWHPTR